MPPMVWPVHEKVRQVQSIIDDALSSIEKFSIDEEMKEVNEKRLPTFQHHNHKPGAVL